MTLTVVIFSILTLGQLRAQTISVCEALASELELNGKSVKIRGIWNFGDTGQELVAVTPCQHPTIRDGWLFPDTIEVVPRRGSLGLSMDMNLRLRKKYGEWAVRVVVTLYGRFETRLLFETYRDAFGMIYPRAFQYSAARLLSRRADDFEVVTYTPAELARELERAGKPLPKRVQ
jgi:hypothetical protein